MTNHLIRSARPSDLSSLSAIEASAVEIYGRYGRPLDDDWDLTPDEHWASYLAAGLLWVAEADAEPMGFLAAERRDNGLYVADVAVALGHQQRGVGRSLMQTAIDFARLEGLAEVTLTTNRSVPWNPPFYRRLGFVELGVAAMPAHLAATFAAESGLRDRCGMRLSL
jgi:GNAT superfamily N-acetyltransferase